MPDSLRDNMNGATSVERMRDVSMSQPMGTNHLLNSRPSSSASNDTKKLGAREATSLAAEEDGGIVGSPLPDSRQTSPDRFWQENGTNPTAFTLDGYLTPRMAGNAIYPFEAREFGNPQTRRVQQRYDHAVPRVGFEGQHSPDLRLVQNPFREPVP